MTFVIFSVLIAFGYAEFLGSDYVNCSALDIIISILSAMGFDFMWNSYSSLISVSGDNYVNIKSELNFNIRGNELIMLFINVTEPYFILFKIWRFIFNNSFKRIIKIMLLK